MPPPGSAPDLASTLADESAWILRLARRLIADAHAAEDAAQSTLAAALERRPSAAKPIRPWLARTARNIIFKKNRGDARRNARERTAAARESSEATDALVERAALHRAVVGAVLALDEPYRTAILLRFMEDLPPREIAARLKIPVRTAQTRIQRGLDRLREIFIQQKRDRGGIFGLALPVFARRGLRYKLSFLTLAMTTKAKFSACAAIALLLLFGIWQWTGGGAPATLTPKPAREIATVSGSTASRELSKRTDANPSTAPASATPSPADRDHEIYGKTIDTAGKPVAGAAITIFTDLARYTDARLATGTDRERMRRIYQTTTSNEIGEFAVSATVISNYDVEAKAAGFATSIFNDRHAGEFLQIVLPRAATISGRVVRGDRTPVEGARVMLSTGEYLSFRQTNKSLVTDKFGAFSSADLAAGDVEVYVESISAQVSDFYSITVAEGESKQCEIVLKSGSYIYGRVTDAESGKPIEGAEVATHILFKRFVTTNADGLFMCEGLRPGSGTPFFVRAKGYAMESPDASVVPESGLKLDVQLKRGRTARGKIIDPDGKPIIGAFVLAGAETKDQQTSFTNDAGDFLINDLRGDVHHTLVIRKEGFGSVQYVFPPREDTSREIDFGNITLQLPGSISGTVVDRLGAPVANARVTLSGVNGDTDRFAEGNEFKYELVGPELRLRSDARGRFYFCELAEGEYTIQAWIPGSCESTHSETVHLKRGERVSNCNFVVDRGLPLEGTIVGPDGKPVSGAYVAVLRPGSENEFINYIAYQHTNTDGAFHFLGLSAGSYTIEIDTTTNLHVSFDRIKDSVAPISRFEHLEAGSRDLRILLKKNDPIEGIVVGLDGQPVAKAWVLRGKPWSRQLMAQTDENGHFKISATEGSLDRMEIGPPANSNNISNDKDPRTYFEDVAAGSKSLVLKLKNYP
ncbi:MAG: sigma-70 family RNA polymerase sigma factor [Planctomycetes bacterium]|nr:sigma-70 family RNA polymerase sigma factor [Planctomycetota bacterium]